MLNRHYCQVSLPFYWPPLARDEMRVLDDATFSAYFIHQIPTGLRGHMSRRVMSLRFRKLLLAHAAASRSSDHQKRYRIPRRSWLSRHFIELAEGASRYCCCHGFRVMHHTRALLSPPRQPQPGRNSFTLASPRSASILHGNATPLIAFPFSCHFSHAHRHVLFELRHLDYFHFPRGRSRWANDKMASFQPFTWHCRGFLPLCHIDWYIAASRAGFHCRRIPSRQPRFLYRSQSTASLHEHDTIWDWYCISLTTILFLRDTLEEKTSSRKYCRHIDQSRLHNFPHCMPPLLIIRYITRVAKINNYC